MASLARGEPFEDTQLRRQLRADVGQVILDRFQRLLLCSLPPPPRLSTASHPHGQHPGLGARGQQGRTAVDVVDDCDLEVRAFQCLGIDQVTGVGDVLDDGRGDPAADVALYEGLAEPDAENLRRTDSAVGTGDDVEIPPTTKPMSMVA